MIIDSLITVAAFLTLAISLSLALPHNNPPQDDPHQRFIPFDEFLEGVKGATFAQWNHTAVESPDAFNVMKNRILTMYDGIATINQSFVLDVEYGDCVDVLNQPTLRILGLGHIESEPLNSSFPSLSEGRGEKFEFVESPLKLDLKDRFGNCISCPERTIPFARLTLEKLTAFKTLDDFFAKSEEGSGFASVSRDVPSRRSLVRRDNEAHLHAVGYQWVTNYGGNSWLELWNPVGDFILRSSGIWEDPGTTLNRSRVAGSSIPRNSIRTKRFFSSSILLIIIKRRNVGIMIAQRLCKPTTTGSWVGLGIAIA